MTRTGRILTALPILAAVALAPAAADAQHYRYGGGHRGYGGGGYGYGPRHFGPGPLIGGAILGLGLGAAIASAPRYYEPRYYAPPTVYYAPPPAYYAPPPSYYAPPAYYAPPGYYPPPGYYGR